VNYLTNERNIENIIKYALNTELRKNVMQVHNRTYSVSDVKQLVYCDSTVGISPCPVYSVPVKLLLAN